MADLIVERKPLQRERVENSKKYRSLHYHTNIELYYLLEGNVKYFINNKSFLLNPGDLIIVPKKALHSTDYQGCLHGERLLLVFDENLYFEDLMPIVKNLCKDNIIHIPKEKLPIIDDIFGKIEKELNKPSEYEKLLIKTYISQLLLYLDIYRIKQPQDQEFDHLITKVVDYISQNYTKDISLPVLSKAFNLSDSYLSRRFKSIIGTNINEYINYIRITKASQLLKNEKMPITEIAIKCGFNDPNYFACVFKKLKGITPYKYMKKHHK
ncbi:MAG: helix-turn-helix domain-containing protein [Clostridia bacterium]|nr:helix-turn-helix domain-containing protein [Clostridia bacterium]